MKEDVAAVEVAVEDCRVASVHELEGLAELEDEPEDENAWHGEIELPANVPELAEVAAVVELEVRDARVSCCRGQFHEDVFCGV